MILEIAAADFHFILIFLKPYLIEWELTAVYFWTGITKRSALLKALPGSKRFKGFLFILVLKKRKLASFLLKLAFSFLQLFTRWKQIL